MLPPDLRKLLVRIITVLSRPSDPGRSGSSCARVALCQTWEHSRDFAIPASQDRLSSIVRSAVRECVASTRHIFALRIKSFQNEQNCCNDNSGRSAFRKYSCVSYYIYLTNYKSESNSLGVDPID